MSFSINDLWKLIQDEKLDIVEVREALLLYRRHKAALKKLDEEKKNKAYAAGRFEIKNKQRKH